MNKTWIAAFAMAAVVAHAQQAAPVTAEAPWVRASVQGQSGTGAFMRLVTTEPLTLVGASSPVAGVTEVHEMKMEGDIMRMRAAGPLQLAPGKPLEMKPGGYHVMLMALKAPLKPDTRIPLALEFRTARGETRRLELSVPVAVRAPEGAAHKH